MYLTVHNFCVMFDVFVYVSRAKWKKICSRWHLRFIFTRFLIFWTRFFRSLRPETSMVSLQFLDHQSSKISEEKKISKAIFYWSCWTPSRTHSSESPITKNVCTSPRFLSSNTRSVFCDWASAHDEKLSLKSLVCVCLRKVESWKTGTRDSRRIPCAQLVDADKRSLETMCVHRSQVENISLCPLKLCTLVMTKPHSCSIPVGCTRVARVRVFENDCGFQLGRSTLRTDTPEHAS